MNLRRENDILEKTLSLAEEGYAAAYRFLLEKYERQPDDFGPQALYFLACLAGGDGQTEQALMWLDKSIRENGWWYRPEVLEDDDLASLHDNPAFCALKALSDGRYAEAASKSRAVFSRRGKTADKLFLAVHGNTQNAQLAREDWRPLLGSDWQLETIQSAEPDGYGTYRWSYDMTSYLPVAEAIEKVQDAGYEKLVCGGFSAGCDMLLRAIALSPARCDALVLQSPWIPMLENHARELIDAIRQKNIHVKIRCGSEDGDCLPMAEQLHELLHKNGVPAELTIQPGNRHQFPETEALSGA
ncbi:MAG: hypothetical protein SPH82_01250 [Eubacteriales bacterium]|nr:hypothetical protein [Eubacteriales bacterium]